MKKTSKVSMKQGKIDKKERNTPLSFFTTLLYPINLSIHQQVHDHVEEDEKANDRGHQNQPRFEGDGLRWHDFVLNYLADKAASSSALEAAERAARLP